MTALPAIGILGATGRMGRLLVREAASGAYPCRLAAAVSRAGEGAAAPGVSYTTDAAGAAEICDVLIDFTGPEASVLHAGIAAAAGTAIVVGTTGLSAGHEAALREASRKIPVFYSANMSVGVNLLAALVEQAAARLSAEAFDIEIFEAHHRHKIDAPSGTALLLGRAAAAGRGATAETFRTGAREGARKAGEIGFSVSRGGDVVGDHAVTFAGDGERLELGHRASDRAVFAKGALRAALWAVKREPGFYDMRAMLGME